MRVSSSASTVLVTARKPNMPPLAWVGYSSQQLAVGAVPEHVAIADHVPARAAGGTSSSPTGWPVWVPIMCSPKYRLPSLPKVTLEYMRSEKVRTGFCTPVGAISTTAGVSWEKAHRVLSGAKVRPPTLCRVPVR